MRACPTNSIVPLSFILVLCSCEGGQPALTHPPQEPDQAFEAVLRTLENPNANAETNESDVSEQTGEQRLQGTPAVVLEFLEVDRYTYARVRTPQETYWTAGPKTVFEKGQPVRLYGGNWMYNFESKALGRTFDRILFVSRYLTPKKLSSDTPTAVATESAKKPTANSSPFKNTPNIAALLKSPPADGTTASIQGEVTKVTPGILGKTWIHIRDYSAAPPQDDLICTLPGQYTPKLGEKVVVDGTLKRNVDLGSGYSYELLLEATGYAALTP